MRKLSDLVNFFEKLFQTEREQKPIPRDHFQTTFYNAWSEVFQPENFLYILIESRLAKFGIELSKDQTASIKKSIRTNIDDFSVGLTDEQEAKIPTGEIASILDFSDLNFSEEQYIELLNNAEWNFIEKQSDKLIASWKNIIPNEVERIRNQRKNFNNELLNIWSMPLNNLLAFTDICTEKGVEFNSNIRSNLEEDREYLIEVITRLHARGCQVSKEINTLLSNGFADGAHARWRTLHEISVVAGFISKHGNELAEKYCDQIIVKKYKIFKEYANHYTKIHYQAPSEEESKLITEAYEQVINTNGLEFARREYEWARGYVNNPTFAGIEESLNLEFMRPFYKLSLSNIHADAHGVFFRLGMPEGEDLLIAGSSIYGLGEVIQNTSYSLNYLTQTLLLLENENANLDSLINMMSLTKFSHEVVWSVDELMEQQLQNQESN